MEEKKNKKMNGVEPANKNVEWSKPEIRVEEKWGKNFFQPPGGRTDMLPSP